MAAGINCHANHMRNSPDGKSGLLLVLVDCVAVLPPKSVGFGDSNMPQIAYGSYRCWCFLGVFGKPSTADETLVIIAEHMEKQNVNIHHISVTQIGNNPFCTVVHCGCYDDNFDILLVDNSFIQCNAIFMLSTV